MIDNLLEYKGYSAKVHFSISDRVLYGKIEGIADLVTFESDDAATVEDAFKNAVDEYVDFCKEVGKSPDKSYKGTFNIRIAPQLHKELAMKAFRGGTTINSEVEKAISEYVSKDSAFVNTIAKMDITISHFVSEKYANSSHSSLGEGYTKLANHIFFDPKNYLSLVSERGVANA